MVNLGDFAFLTHQKTLLRFNFCEPLVVFFRNPGDLQNPIVVNLWRTRRGRRFRDGFLCGLFWSRRASYFCPFRFRWVVQCCGPPCVWSVIFLCCYLSAVSMCLSLVRSRAISLVRGVVFVTYAVAVYLFLVTTIFLPQLLFPLDFGCNYLHLTV